MDFLEKDYDTLKILHTKNIQKLQNIQKKIERMRRDISRLQYVANELLDTNTRNSFKIRLYKKRFDCSNKDDVRLRTFREKVDYTVRCIDWLRKYKTQHTINMVFSRMSTDVIIGTCHKLYHDHLLNNFTFTLERECSRNGCMSWTYGHTRCYCGKTMISYNKKNINYGYKEDVHIDDEHPLYRISFCNTYININLLTNQSNHCLSKRYPMYICPVFFR